jgi:hypothetical protein
MADEALPLLIVGPGKGPERLMLVGHPDAGRVRVRRWLDDARR